MQTGSCHCGQVSFEVEGDFSEALECNCSHCSRKGYLLAFVPRDRMRILSGEDRLSTYRFNRHVIDHHFCPTCGCAPFGIGKAPDGNVMAAINIRCIEGIEIGAVERKPVDGRSF